MGTWGARFVDAIESYSRDRGRSAVVDATGINDFEDTPLLETLEALIGDEDRATVPVGVIVSPAAAMSPRPLASSSKMRSRLTGMNTT